MDDDIVCERVYDNNRKFVDRFTSASLEAVRVAAQKAYRGIDEMASPGLNGPFKLNGKWGFDVTWYSVD